MYIAIDGRSAAGKTTLSNMLAEALRAPVYHLDEFGSDFEPFIGVPGLVRALETDTNPIVICEGVGVFRDEFDRFSPFRIFMPTKNELRRARAEARDVPRADRTAEDWDRIDEIWKKAEGEYFTDAIRSKADYITPEDGVFNLQELLRAIEVQRA